MVVCWQRVEKDKNKFNDSSDKIMKPPKLTPLTNGLCIEGRDFEVEFSRGGGVFPNALRFSGEAHALVQRGDWSMVWEEEGVVYQPATDTQPRVAELAESLVVNFERVPFVGPEGTPHPDLTVSLEYEIFRDGTGFCVFFLQGQSLVGASVDRFSLRLGFTPEPTWNTDGAYWQFPASVDSACIQAFSGYQRKIPSHETRDFPGKIAPFAGFDSGEGWRRTHHIEFFLEGSGGLSNDSAQTSTCFGREAGRPGITWNLQDRPWHRTPGRAIIYRNVFGFCLTRVPRTLPRPPLRIYHYFDNFRPYPSKEDVADIKRAGADTLILHENWRQDVRNGEFPTDADALRATLEACHQQGIRCGLYFRGNDDGIRERAAEFLTPYLRRNFDGLYLDYGSPFMYLGHEEYAPNGRIHFREYHRTMRKLRNLVGDEGFLLSHSGSYFCALAHASLDGYYGGEQEKGKLLASREHHAYFAGLAVAPAYWWTAAFPIYRTKEAVAVMAATFHAPVVNLGTQFACSSLHQPPSPGTNPFARGLWMLWGLMDGCGPLQVRDSHRSPDAFVCPLEAVAPAALWNQVGEGILTVANLSSEPVTTSLTVQDEAFVGEGEKFLISLRWKGDRAEVGVAQPWNGGKIPSFSLDAHEVAGWLVTGHPSAWDKRLEELTQPPLWTSSKNATWNAFVKEQRAWREEAPSWEECHLQVSIPNWPNTYEDSVWYDLFDNDLLLEMVDASGQVFLLGFLDRHGLHATPGKPENRLTAGDHSPWIPLHKIQNGRAIPFHPTHFRVTSQKNGTPFYLFTRICLSPEPATSPNSRALEFCVDLDPDWSAITFPVK